MKDQPMWTLESGLEFARALEAELAKAGWHCAIAGSVMRLGASVKDLDLVVFPNRSPPGEFAQQSRRKVLNDFGLEIRRTARQMHAHWTTKGSNDLKHVEVWWDKHGRRIDILVLS